MTTQPRMAATVLLLRASSEAEGGIEVFMVRRVVQSKFMPDLYVFPGGSVSADDLLAERESDVCMAVANTEADPEGRTALGSGLRVAAIRELFEEGNVLLAYQDGTLLAITEESKARFQDYRQELNERNGSLLVLARAERLQLATDFLAYFAHWITPEGLPKRFDTHFFLAHAPVKQEAVYDKLETSAGLWISPRKALERSEQGTFPLAFPTFHQLRDLGAYRSVEEALLATTTRYVPTHIPLLVQTGDDLQAYLAEDPDFLWKIT